MTCNRIVVRVPRNKLSFTIPVTVWVTGKKVTVDALIDSGATTTFIDSKIVEKNNLVFRKLAEVHPVYNADGTTNKNGNIKRAVTYKKRIKKALKKSYRKLYFCRILYI